MKQQEENNAEERSLWNLLRRLRFYWSRLLPSRPFRRAGKNTANILFMKGTGGWRKFVWENPSLLPIPLLLFLGSILILQPSSNDEDNLLENSLRDLGWIEYPSPCPGLSAGLYEALGTTLSFEWYQTDQVGTALAQRELTLSDEVQFQCNPISKLSSTQEIK